MLALLAFIFVLNATISNISALSWRPVLVVEEAEVHGENHRVVAVLFLTFVLCYRVWLSCLGTLVLLLQKLYLALQSFDFEHT
jgi:hypothetical protein